METHPMFTKGLNIVKSQYYHTFNVIAIKTSDVFCRNIIKFTWILKGTQIAKAILKRNKSGALSRLHCKTYYNATVTKTYANRIECPEINV